MPSSSICEHLHNFQPCPECNAWRCRDCAGLREIQQERRAKSAEALLQGWLAWEDLERGSEDADDVAKIRQHLVEDTRRIIEGKEI